MASTSMYQVNPDYYRSKEECVASFRKKVNTNPRYSNFKQTHFTAGDDEQFRAYRDPSNGQICIPTISMDRNRFRNMDLSEYMDWERYRNLNSIAVMNTFYYMFEKFKKGIFVKIKNNQLAVFLPFSKKNFTNEWSDRIRVSPKYENVTDFIRYISEMEGRRFFPKSVNKFVESWYANNCLVRYEFPISEGDTNHPNMSDMFKTLCAERKLPDIELFLNRRDFPMIKKNGTEAYEDIFGDNQPLLSHNYNKYAPILSMVTRDGYADVPIPTGDDWARISGKESKFFPKSCREYNDDFIQTPVYAWSAKKPIAVFRGGSTGCGFTVDTNTRLKLAYMSKLAPTDTDGLPFLDAGITNWNIRPRKLMNEKYLQTIDITKMPFGLVNRLTPQEQTEYKYIIHVDGHVSAFRLSLELGMGCCILLVDSRYKLWFRPMLQPYVHYVPVKADLSDLLERVKWCKENDQKCEDIAKNAKKFYTNYLGKDGILDYLQKLLLDLKRTNGVYLYNEKTPFDLQIENEEKQLSYDFPKIGKTLVDMGTIPNQPRSSGMLQGMNWLLNMVHTHSSFFEIATKQRDVFSSQGSTVEEYTLAEFPVIAKTALRPDKTKENIHEAFVSQKCINRLTSKIPNFVYGFGVCKNSGKVSVLSESVVGITMSDYIKGNDFTMHDYVFITVQIALALHVAQQNCALVHNDLTPWNIIIQRLPTPVLFDYIIDPNTVYRVKTQIVPVIIDYGKSHVIHDGIHYGYINMYRTSTVQDLLSYLSNSIYDITEVEMPRRDVLDLLKLANFISGTKYRAREFIPTGKGGVGDLRYFFRNSKKYTNMVASEKHDLEAKTPLDLFEYIMKNFKLSSIEKTTHATFPPRLNDGNARQVFQYIFSKTIEEKIASFVKVFSRVRKCELPVITNPILTYYIVQNIHLNIQSVHRSMLTFLAQNSSFDAEKYHKKYRKALKYIQSIYTKSVKMSDYRFPEIKGFHSLVHTPYTEETFLSPDRVLNLLSETKSMPKLPDMISFKNEIISTLVYDGTFSVPNEVRDTFIDSYANLLSLNSLVVMNNIANVKTLKSTARSLYTIDREVLQTKLSTENGDCTTATEYMKIYNIILGTN